MNEMYFNAACLHSRNSPDCSPLSESLNRGICNSLPLCPKLLRLHPQTPSTPETLSEIASLLKKTLKIGGIDL